MGIPLPQPWSISPQQSARPISAGANEIKDGEGGVGEASQKEFGKEGKQRWMKGETRASQRSVEERKEK
ncbi:hypothetical protein PBY51_017345 [Eleginops maclovinus]|uniref:Uncharacterized protein n=1 Tax=Eleginops maclovinus TaxID=56733 RepID=A0AAN7XJ43_ELEMC|nr:hypothetical protein PBY51_017345 [Eleginops maclovinus]